MFITRLPKTLRTPTLVTSSKDLESGVVFCSSWRTSGIIARTSSSVSSADRTSASWSRFALVRIWPLSSASRHSGSGYSHASLWPTSAEASVDPPTVG